MRIILTEAFEVFTAHLLGVEGEITSKEPGADEDDVDVIENEFRGRTWHNLIYFHFRWDRQMLLRWSLTNESYREVLPSYLCASVLWPEVEALIIASDLLAPIDTHFSNDRKTMRFGYVTDHLNDRERAVVRRFLLHSVMVDKDNFEFYFSTSEQKIIEAVEKYWGNRGGAAV